MTGNTGRRIRVECVEKSDRLNPHERIIAIGGRNPGGSRWRRTQAEAISDIENGVYSFYVQHPLSNPVDVIVATSRYGHKYIKTTPDGEQPNNLLSLAECALV